MDSTRVVRIPFPREPSSSSWPPQAPAPSLTVDQEAGIWAQGVNQEVTVRRRAPLDVRLCEWLPEQGWIWNSANTIQVPWTPAFVQEMTQADATAKQRMTLEMLRSEWTPHEGWLWPVVNGIQVPWTPAFTTEMGQEYRVSGPKRLHPSYQTWTEGDDWLWADTLPAVQQSVAAWQSQMIQEYALRPRPVTPPTMPEWAQRVDWIIPSDVGPQVASWSWIFATETQQEYRVRARPPMDPFRWWQPERTDWLYGPATAALPSQWPAIDALLKNADETPVRRNLPVWHEWMPQYGWITAILGVYDPTPFPRPHGEMVNPGRGRQLWALPDYPRQDWLYGEAVAALPGRWPAMDELWHSDLPPLSRKKIRSDAWDDGPGWIVATFPPAFDVRLFPFVGNDVAVKGRRWFGVDDRNVVLLIFLPPGLGAWNATLADRWLPGRLPVKGQDTQDIGWISATFPPAFDVRLFPRLAETLWVWKPRQWPQAKERTGASISPTAAFDPQFFPMIDPTLWVWRPRQWPEWNDRFGGGIDVPPDGAEAWEVIQSFVVVPAHPQKMLGDDAQGIGWVVSTFPPTFDPQLFPRVAETIWLWKPKPWPKVEDRSDIRLIILPPGIGAWNAPEPFMTRARPKLRPEPLTTTDFWGMTQVIAGYVPFDAAMEQLVRSEMTVRKRAPMDVRLLEWSPEFGWIEVYLPTPPAAAIPTDFLVWLRRRRR